MLEYLVQSGFSYIAHNETWIIVQDPRHQNYRVYNSSTNPSEYANAHIEADRHDFDWVEDAANFAGIPF